VTLAILAALAVLAAVPPHPGAAAEPAPPVEVLHPGDFPPEGTTGEPSTSPEDYRIGPEDQIRISVWDNRDLTQEVVVRPDGKISLPLVQDVVAEGLTAPELAADLSRRLSAFLKEPQVSVILLQVNAPKVYIIGAVARPGTYPLRGSMTVLQALALAGGMTPFADTGAIRIVRTSGGKQKMRKVSYSQMIGAEGKGNYLLKPGDTIVVP
jgi:polysaccharide export outer membrane protein